MEHKTLSPYFSTSIIIAIFLGVITGVVVSSLTYDPESLNMITMVTSLVGDIFLVLLRMLVIPVVFVSLVTGISSMPGTHKLGAIGSLTIGLYLLTTVIAVSMALFVTHSLHVGAGFEVVDAIKPPSLPSIPHPIDVIRDFIPENIISAMANGKIIQVLVFAALLGVAILRSGEGGQRFALMLRDIHTVLISLVMMVMQFAPIGVYAITTGVVLEQGIGFLGSIAGYFFTVVFVLLLQVLLVYGIMLRVWVKTSLFTFLQKIVSAFTFAFSVSSSLAAIPMVLQVAKNRLKVSNETAAFVIPLGATINMDGTAIMQGVATVFLSQVYGVDLSMDMYVVVVLLAVFSSVGTAGVPGAGLLTLSMVLHEVGIPVEGIVMILGVDRLLDMIRTGVNITGDLTIAMVVDKRVAGYKKRQPVDHKKAETISL